MIWVETVARFEGVTELVLERLVSLGYFRTRTEALRAGVLNLGREYSMLENAREMEDELAVRKMQKISEEIDAGKRKLIPLAQVLKKAGIRERDL